MQCVAAVPSGRDRRCVTDRVDVCVNQSLMVLDVNSANLGSIPTRTARVGVPRHPRYTPTQTHTQTQKLFLGFLLILFFCKFAELNLQNAAFIRIIERLRFPFNCLSFPSVLLRSSHLAGCRLHPVRPVPLSAQLQRCGL